MAEDKSVLERKEILINEANIIIEAIKSLSPDKEDPLSDPETLNEAVKIGILDAPHLQGSKIAKGKLKTRLVSGALYAYDEENGKIIGEEERTNKLLKEAGYDMLRKF